MSATELVLDRVYHWEAAVPDRIYLTQPMGGGVVRDFTWKETLDQARRMAAHLRSLDLAPPSQIALFSKNTAFWVMADLAIMMAGHVSVPLYPLLTPEAIRQILDHSEAKLILIGKLDGFDAMQGGIPDDLPRIRMPLGPPIEAPSWDDIVAGTEPLADNVRRAGDEMATIAYTSGSTGVPKGVMLSFEAMARSGAGIVHKLGLREDERLLSYLPLAHLMERAVVEHTSFQAGFHLFFAESLDTFVDDLKRTRPTVFLSVPRLWLKFQAGVFAKMPPKKLARLLKIPILSSIVRKKILQGLGFDQLRFAGSGSAPIPPDLIRWYRDLGLELLEGYGMSENCAYSHLTTPGHGRVGYVGTCNTDVECRLSEEGEILVKSPGTMMGYFKEPELTAEVLTDDGFLKTGDRGEIDEEGRLRITGRVKELFKTSKGKYVAPAPIENKLLEHPLLEQVCVTGSGFAQAFALVVLAEGERATPIEGQRKAEIEARLNELFHAVNDTLLHHERLQCLIVVQDLWTIENGFLTPTMKLKRAKIEDTYLPLAEAWCETGAPVVWKE